MRYRLLYAAAMAVLPFFVFAGIFACEGALHPAKQPIGPEAIATADRIPQAFQIREDVSIRAADGVELRAWFFAERGGAAHAAILLHGIGDNRAGMLAHARMLLRNGWDVLVPDSRAHGASGGDAVTYGVREAGDVVRWADWLAHERNERLICGLGESMGAGILLESLAKTDRIRAAVAESPFANMREIAYTRFGQMFERGPWVGRWPLRPALEIGLLYARLRYGVPLADASPIEAIAHTKIPVLLIHSEADDNVPLWHSEELLRAAGPNVKLWKPANTPHAGAIGRYPGEFERRVLECFGAVSREP